MISIHDTFYLFQGFHRCCLMMCNPVYNYFVKVDFLIIMFPVEEPDRGPPFRELYKTLCDKHGCNPTSYFLRHLDEKEVHMKHHGLTRHESLALAEVLRVRGVSLFVRP